MEAHTPTRVLKLPPVKRITASFSATCAWTESGDLYCWGEPGWDSFSPLDVAHPLPIKVDGFGQPVVEAAIETDHLCVILADQSVWCRGAGELLGSDSLDHGPRQVMFVP